MRQACYHDWAQSPAHDTCRPDGKKCVLLTDTEHVVCHHTKFLKPCDQKNNKCLIDGSTCLILDVSQSIVCHHNFFQTFGGYNCDCKKVDGVNVKIVNRPFEPDNWKQSAVIIMDMWDKHWCNGAAERVKELAGPINSFIKVLRGKGALIIHSPSDVVDFYKSKDATCEERQARKNATDANDPTNPNNIALNRNPTYYLSDDPTLSRTINLGCDGRDGCDDYPDRCKKGSPWTRQIADIKIEKEDAMVGQGTRATYQEVLALTQNRQNLIYCGVHLNMCVLSRPNATRAMYKAGKSLWIVRDLVDAMCVRTNYNDEYYDHFAGLDRAVDWYANNLGAITETSTFVTGQPRFNFIRV